MNVSSHNKKEILCMSMAFIAICLIWNFIAGKDLNWDSLNYHYYAGYSLFNNRFDLDFFAAGEQGYFNPVLYAPFYLMITWGWSDLFVASGLSVIHSLSLIFLYMVSGELVGWEKENLKYRLYACLIGMLCIPVLHLIGSSFGDLIVANFQMAAVYFCLLAIKRGGIKFWCISALLMGMSAGLKLSGLVFCAVFALVCIIYALVSRRGNIVIILCCGLSGILGFLFFSGYWAFRLYVEFGNPFFPLFNDIFKSDYYVQESWTDNRFRPSHWLGALEYPMRMVYAKSGIYEEHSPDIRAITALVLSVSGIAFSLFYRGVRKNNFIISFVVIFWVAFFLWIYLSANARYGLVLLLLLGPVIVCVVKDLLTNKLMNSVCMLVLIIQGFMLYTLCGARFSQEEWSGEWYGFEVPKSITENSYLFLTANNVSFSFLYEKLNPKSSMINIGGTEINNDVLSKGIMEKYYSLHDGKVKGIFKNGYLDAEVMADEIKSYQPVFSKFGFVVDETSCDSIVQKSNQGEILKKLLSCDLIYDSSVVVEYKKNLEYPDRVFDIFEKECSVLIQSTGVVTNVGPAAYYRYYPGNAITVWLDKNKMVYVERERMDFFNRLGSSEDFFREEVRSKLSDVCQKISQSLAL